MGNILNKIKANLKTIEGRLDQMKPILEKDYAAKKAATDLVNNDAYADLEIKATLETDTNIKTDTFVTFNECISTTIENLQNYKNIIETSKPLLDTYNINAQKMLDRLGIYAYCNDESTYNNANSKINIAKQYYVPNNYNTL